MKRQYAPDAGPEHFWFWDKDGDFEKYPLNSEIQVDGLPGVITNVSFDHPRAGVTVAGIYGRFENGLILGLTCAELKSHSWENVTSLHDKNYMERCRRCGEWRDTGRAITEDERAQALAEFEKARYSFLTGDWDEPDDVWATMEVAVEL